MFPLDVEQATHLLNLHDEEIGVRHRIQHFYLPLFREFCCARGLEIARTRVLDCGCGNGVSVEILAEAGFRACGIDGLTPRCRQWSERPPLARATFCQAEATHVPFADASFDIILSCGLLEHIGVEEYCDTRYRVTALPHQAENRRQFLAECLRVLCRGGVLYLDHPNGAFPIDFWHNDGASRPRWHRATERFLPKFEEVAALARSVDAACRVEALSPAGRFTFRRARRHWYGKLFGPPLDLYLHILRYRPFSFLARSPFNPYLVLRITRD